MTKKSKKKTKAVGRPKNSTKVNPEDPFVLSVINKLAAEGKTNAEIADIVDLSESSIYRYQNLSQNFSHALKGGKDVAVAMVEDAIFQKAIGWRYREKKVSFDKDGNRNEYWVEHRQPPDTAAAQFILKNHKPNEYKDKPEGEEEVPINPILINIPAKDIAAMLKKSDEDTQE